MNEELKIFIRAVTSDAKKNLAGVKKELAAIEGESQKAQKAVDVAMKSVAKGAAAAIASIVALTGAMVALGKSTDEFRKAQTRVITGFQASGSSAQQANKTFQELYRFLGDNDTAAEAANLLAKLTTNEQELAEWTKILQGVYATFPDSLPVEALAEAANETARTGVVTGNLADALNWAGVSEDAFNAALAQTSSLSERELLIRNTLNGLYGNAAALYERNNIATLRLNESQFRLNVAMANAARYTIPLRTELNNLAAVLLQVLQPAFETVAATIIVLVQWIIAAIQYIGSFFGLFQSEGKKATTTVSNISSNMGQVQSSVSDTVSGVTGLGSALGDAATQAAKLRKETMGFDELNIVSSQTSVSTGGGSVPSVGGGGGGISGGGLPSFNPSDFEVPGLDDFEDKIEGVRKNLKIILPLIGAVAAGIGLWKIADFFLTFKNTVGQIKEYKQVLKELLEDSDVDPTVTKSVRKDLRESKDELDVMKNKLKTIGGSLMIVAGAVLLVKGYFNAWTDGIDWGNLATTIAGISLVVGGIALAFGPLAAGIAAIVGGIALVVLGVKDFIENGYSMQNVLMILAGVIAIVVGVCLAFNAALLANPITWIVIGIAALVAAFVILWNECEGFRNFWINLWEIVKTAFSAFWDSIQPWIKAIGNAFTELWELLKVIWNNYIVPLFIAAWEAIKKVWDFVKPYFQMIWENIKVIFSVVVEVLGAYFRLAWEAIKAVWNVVVAWFSAIWNSIAGIFSVVKNVLTGNWKEAWEGIKGIVSSWKDYFSTVWESIKKIFSAVGTFFSTAFGAAWEGIKKVFSNIGNFFSGIWEKIKSIFSKVGSTIGNAITNTVKTAINGVLSTAVKIINGFIGAINLAIDIINAIPGVEITKIAKLSVPKLATGGILTGETLFVGGEGGKKEAVLPLEQNTEWMDILADRIASRNNTPSKIVLTVDGKELGWASINGINGITRQTGNLQLVLV